MIKLKQLLETRIIGPHSSLTTGDITLYHGTTWDIAKLAKKGELGPVDPVEYVVNILMAHFNKTEEEARNIVKVNLPSTRRKDPSRLFLTTDKEQATRYAQAASKYGGEMVTDMLSNYLPGPRGKSDFYKHMITDNPAVVIVTVPLEMVLTHPYWTTPLKRRLINIYYTLKKYSEIAKYIDELQPGIEVFVSEKIPAKYIQRIERVEPYKIDPHLLALDRGDAS